MLGERGGGGGLPSPAVRRKEAGNGAWKGKPGRWDGLGEDSQVGVASGLCPVTCRRHHSQGGSGAARRKAGAGGQGWLRQLCQEL